MEDGNENSNEENDINQYLNDMKTFISTKNKNDLDKLSEKLEIAKKNLMHSSNPENLVRSAIIHFITNYSKISVLSKNKEVKELIDEFILYFPKKDVIEKSLDSLNKKFKKASPSVTIVSFRKEINIKKNHLEFYFKVLMLLQNINDIIEGINNQLGVKNDYIQEILEKINFENPYAVLLIRDLINELILKENDIKVEDTLQNIIENIKKYYPFYCPNCFEILLVVYGQNTSFYCPKEKLFFSPKDTIELKNKLIINMKCKACNEVIEIYDNNYKCNDCKNLYCQQCAKEHEKSDIKNVMFNLYELGYICEEHCELYTSSCNVCQINLCEICKESHRHKIDMNNILSLDESLLKSNSSKDINEITEIKEYILAKLALMYQYMRNFNLNNYTIRTSIYFGEKPNRKNVPDTKKFYFEQFFNDSFKNYYSKLIKNIAKGKKEYYKILISIKNEYELLGYKVDPSFKGFNEQYLEEKENRSQNINYSIFNTKIAFNWLDLNDENIKQKNINIVTNNQSLKLQVDIQLLKIKIIALLKSNKLYTSYLMKIINRYLSEILLRKIFEKYPSKFSPIQISLKNFYEIANNFTNIIYKNNKNNSILNNLINSLKLLKNQNSNEVEKKNSYIEGTKDNNKIMFISPIKIKNETFSASEMNYVLDTLFYFKKQGNIIAHMNIEPKESIKLKNINKNIPDIVNFLGNLDNMDIFDSNNDSNNIINGTNNINNDIHINSNNEININTNEINITLSDKEIAKAIISNINNEKQDWLEIEDDIIKGTINIISSIKNQILSDFYDSSIIENLNINDVINCIFRDDFRNMFTSNSAFTRVLSSTIDEMIKSENININFSKFNEIKELIRKTHNKIKSFDKLKNNLNKFNLELSEKVYRQTKNYIKNYINNLSFEDPETKLVSLKDNFSQILEDLTEKDVSFPNFDLNEKRALIISLIIPHIQRIQLNNQDIFLKEIKKSIENYYIILNAKNIIEKLHNNLESSLNIRIENNTKKEIKKYISSRNTSNTNDSNYNYEKIIDIIGKIFEGEKIQWTQLPKSDISLESLLFFYQNK